MSTKSLIKTNESFPSLFDNFFKPWNEWFPNGGSFSPAIKVPAVNIIETANEYEVSLAAPGLKKSDFHIELDGNIITINSRKEESKEEKEKSYTRKEYNYSSFSRSFSLPEDVKQENVEASYEEGILKMILPKKDEAKNKTLSKNITVK